MIDADEAELRALLEALPPEDLERLAKEIAGKPADLAELRSDRARVVTRHKITGCFDLSRVENAAEQIGKLPGADEAVHFMMGGRFAAADMIPAIQQLAGEPIAELYIATLGFSKQNVEQFATLLDEGTVKRLTLICSAYFKDTEGMAYGYGLQQLAELRDARLAKTRNHAKVVLFRFGRRYFVVEASANIRSCLSLEQVALIQSRRLFQFHRQWMEKVLTVEGGK
ncbi:hypothetical protein ACXR0O_19110 [Verrucomicrobiota bacterium sgz303538]